MTIMQKYGFYLIIAQYFGDEGGILNSIMGCFYDFHQKSVAANA